MNSLFRIEPVEAGQRLDRVLATRFGLAPREVRRLVAEGRIRVDGRALLAGAPRQETDTAVEILRDAVDPALLPEDIPLRILFETDRLAAIDKPAGMAMYPGPGRPAGTLANALRGLGWPLSACEGPLRPGIVHRLDAGTSGVVLVAKDDDMHLRLKSLFRRHALERRYLALVHGCPDWELLECRKPLAPKPTGRKGMRVFSGGRSAWTRFRVVARNASTGLIAAFPLTGRTHQIRVHLAHLGFPLIGDTLYGGGRPATYPAHRLGIGRTALHAERLACGEVGVDVRAPLPEDFLAAIRNAGLSRAPD